MRAHATTLPAPTAGSWPILSQAAPPLLDASDAYGTHPRRTPRTRKCVAPVPRTARRRHFQAAVHLPSPSHSGITPDTLQTMTSRAHAPGRIYPRSLAAIGAEKMGASKDDFIGDWATTSQTTAPRPPLVSNRRVTWHIHARARSASFATACSRARRVRFWTFRGAELAGASASRSRPRPLALPSSDREDYSTETMGTTLTTPRSRQRVRNRLRKVCDRLPPAAPQPARAPASRPGHVKSHDTLPCTRARPRTESRGDPRRSTSATLRRFHGRDQRNARCGAYTPSPVAPFGRDPCVHPPRRAPLCLGAGDEVDWPWATSRGGTGDRVVCQVGASLARSTEPRKRSMTRAYRGCDMDVVQMSSASAEAGWRPRETEVRERSTSCRPVLTSRNRWDSPVSPPVADGARTRRAHPCDEAAPAAPAAHRPPPLETACSYVRSYAVL